MRINEVLVCCTYVSIIYSGCRLSSETDPKRMEYQVETILVSARIMEVYMDNKLMHIYEALLFNYGDPLWWPAETPYEVIVGAVLTQNTSWET